MQTVIGICAKAVVQMSFSGEEKDLSAMYSSLLQPPFEKTDAGSHEICRSANDHLSPDSRYQTSMERVPLKFVYETQNQCIDYY